ncbi:MAG: alanine racemase [Oscillospiraceae bacterium]
MPPKCQLMAVVKAEAYGHRAFEISTCLEKIGVKAFAVATIDEGILLKKIWYSRRNSGFLGIPLFGGQQN